MMDIPHPLVSAMSKQVRGSTVTIRQILLPAFLARYDNDATRGYDVKDMDNFAPDSPVNTNTGAWTQASPEWDYVFPSGDFSIGSAVDATVQPPNDLAHEVIVQNPRLDLYRHVLEREQRVAAEYRRNPL